MAVPTKSDTQSRDSISSHDNPRRKLGRDLPPSRLGSFSIHPDLIANGKSDAVLNIDPQKEESMIKPSWRRFMILFLYCANSCNKNYQWIQIPATTMEATRYYGVSSYVINFCSALFMITFLGLSTPACYLVNRIGLRKSIVLTSIGTTLGSVIKCYSCHDSGIYYILIGSVFVSLSEQLIYSMPSKLAATWFPDNEVSTAVCVCFVGSQIGTALGFIIPQFFLHGAETKEDIGNGFYLMFLYTSIISIVILVLSIIFFDDAPKFAPGKARLRQLEAIKRAEEAGTAEQGKGLIKDMIELNKQCFKLLRSKSMIMMTSGYGIVMAISLAMVTILDQAIEEHFPEDEQMVGDTGFIMVLAGLLTLPICGRVMDASHAYKLVNLLLTLLSTLSLTAFFAAIQFTTSKLLIYVTAFLFGSFSFSLMAAGIELAVEMTYPSAEIVTSTLLSIILHIFAIPFIFVSSYIVTNYGLLAANIFFTVAGAIALLCSLVAKEKLKRLEAAELNEDFVKQRSHHRLSLCSATFTR